MRKLFRCCHGYGRLFGFPLTLPIVTPGDKESRGRHTAAGCPSHSGDDVVRQHFVSSSPSHHPGPPPALLKYLSSGQATSSRRWTGKPRTV
jgi:hypothetical protein